MSHRSTLLRQHIRRVMNPASTPLLVAIAICSSQPVTLLAAENHYAWSCRAKGDTWRCSEKATTQPPYKRPRHTSEVSRASAAKDRSAGPGSAAAMDWVAVEDLSAEERKQAEAESTCCKGVYRAPARQDEEAKRKPENSPARITADTSEWQHETTTMMSGDVRLTKGFRQLRADRASIDQATNDVLLEGDIQLREPGLLLTGVRADLNMQNGTAKIADASYLLHATSIRGDADVIARGEDRLMVMRGASLTRCEPGDNTWLLRGSEILIDPDSSQATGKHMRLSFKGVPVLYAPWLRFSTSDERQSGVLFPSMSNSDDGGFDFTLPYYFNLAPNYDATLSPRIIADRGAMLEAEGRHLSRQSETIVSAAYLGDDDGGSDEDLQSLVDDGTITEAEAYPFRGDDRWLFNIDHTGGLQAPWYSRIDFTATSDDDYFSDMDTASLEVNASTHLKKSGIVGYKTGHWDYELKVEEYQSITTRAEDPYKQLPRLSIDGDYVFGDQLNLQLDHEIVRFDHRDEDDLLLVTGDRMSLDYGLDWNKQWLWGFFKPGIGVKGLSYQLDDTYLNADANDAPSFSAGQAKLDMGLIFEREGSLFSSNYLQTFEPRFFYFYRQYENQDELIAITTNGGNVDFDTAELTFSYSQLFRESRFSGGDRIDDANRLSVGLTTRFLDPEDGSEMFSASIGQILYFEDRAIDLLLTSEEMLASDSGQANNSAYAVELGAEFGSNWKWDASIDWDPDDSDRASSGSSSIRYQDDHYRVFNLAYYYQRRDAVTDTDDLDDDGDTTDLVEQTVEQGEVSFATPVWGNWSVVGSYTYDFTHGRELERLFGIEYDTCCYSTRIVARRWIDNELIDVIDSLDFEQDEGIYFEFHFKSLGGIGSKVSDLLAESIYGYQDRNL